MPHTDYEHEVAIWTDADRADTCQQIIDRMGTSVKPIAIGGPRVTEIDQFARAYECDAFDDMRKMLVDRPASYVLIASSEAIQPGALINAARHGANILAIEPLFADLAELNNPDFSQGKPIEGAVVALPAFMQSPGWLSAAEPTQALGVTKLIHFLCAGLSGRATLYARLHDAWAIVLQLSKMPIRVDASLVGPLTAAPGSLRGLTGAMAVHGRLSDGRSIIIMATDQRPVPGRELLVLGDEGQLKVTDLAYALHDSEGKVMDQHEDDRLSSPSFVDLVARQWQRRIDRDFQEAEPLSALITRETLIIACCQACLLSARTGEPESPAKILEMNGINPAKLT